MTQIPSTSNRLGLACPIWVAAAFVLGLYPALGQTNNTNRAPAQVHPARLEFNSFKLITDRNIFNPRRSGYTVKTPAREIRRMDYFALVGTMIYEKGPFAFFEGSSSEFSKVAKTNEAIGGYTVSEIQPGTVKLSLGTNAIDMPVGMQMQREQGGTWRLAARTEAPFVSRGDRGNQNRRTNGSVAAVDSIESTNGPASPGGEPPPIIMVNGEAIPLPPDGGPPGGLPTPPGIAPAGQAEPAAATATRTTATPATPASPDDVLARMRQRAAAERGESP